MSRSDGEHQSRDVKATISVMGRFHAFYLAQVLQVNVAGNAGSSQRCAIQAA